MAAPAESLGLEADLKAFLGEATQAYAEGDMEEYEPKSPYFSKGALFESGGFRILDEWGESTDRRVYSGIEVVDMGRKGARRANRKEIWRAQYSGVVDKRANPDKVLDFYAEALRQPAPELPIRGPRRLEIGDKVYTLDSLHGPLTVARFVVTDQIHQNGHRVYDGHIFGGLRT